MVAPYQPTDSDLALIHDTELREKVVEGEVLMLPPEVWESASKPVLVSKTGQMIKGTGRRKGAKDPAVASRETAFTRRKGYRHLIEEYIPPSDLKDTPNAIISFRELIDALIDACNGSPQRVKCQHEGCGEYHLIGFKKDPNVLFKLYENLAGKARETQDINVTGQHLALVLNERTPITALEVHSIDPAEERRRREALHADGEDGSVVRRLGPVADGGR